MTLENEEMVSVKTRSGLISYFLYRVMVALLRMTVTSPLFMSFFSRSLQVARGPFDGCLTPLCTISIRTHLVLQHWGPCARPQNALEALSITTVVRLVNALASRSSRVGRMVDSRRSKLICRQTRP